MKYLMKLQDIFTELVEQLELEIKESLLLFAYKKKFLNLNRWLKNPNKNYFNWNSI